MGVNDTIKNKYIKGIANIIIDVWKNDRNIISSIHSHISTYDFEIKEFLMFCEKHAFNAIVNEYNKEKGLLDLSIEYNEK